MPRAGKEWQRLSSATSLRDVVAGVVTDFTVAPVQELELSAALTVPTGWLVATAGITPQQPVRAVVTGHRSWGGWQGCETLAAFRFTGMPNADIGTAHAAHTLHDLRAAAITTRHLDVPEVLGVWAVRGNGYLTAAGLRMWAQFSTYVAGSHERGSGRLVEHTLFITAQRRTELRADVTELTDIVHAAVCVSVTGDH